MTIAEIIERGKRIPKEFLVLAILIFACIASFGLGILAGRDLGQGGGVSISQAPLTASPLSKPAEPEISLPAGGQVVASKFGTAYFLPWCGGVKQIKEKNKIWFASAEDAKSAGYKPAANCKGL